VGTNTSGIIIFGYFKEIGKNCDHKYKQLLLTTNNNLVMVSLATSSLIMISLTMINVTS